MKETEVKRGQPITFRIPSDTPEHILKHLQHLKKTQKRNFSSEVAELVINGVSSSLSKHRETLTIPLPKGLSKAQRDWLKHEHSEALLGSIVYQLLANPVRTASLFTSLNSNALEIDDALYLQEEIAASKSLGIEWDSDIPSQKESREIKSANPTRDDDLDDFDWESAKQTQPIHVEEEGEIESVEDLLGDFLAQMNK
ncbi:hypothetical protein [Ectobacillus panaciterrae]|uniref:hypothetical protein n=1 Tax=Ectobacillus panaciterrae TaxID=363872 RepID=UPI0004273A03|nr:hypothetical protein [Ectobacillus panaciterrae]